MTSLPESPDHLLGQDLLVVVAQTSGDGVFVFAAEPLVLFLVLEIKSGVDHLKPTAQT